MACLAFYKMVLQLLNVPFLDLHLPWSSRVAKTGVKSRPESKLFFTTDVQRSRVTLEIRDNFGFF